MGKVHEFAAQIIAEARAALLIDPADDLTLDDFDNAPDDTRMLARVTVALEEMLGCYEGAMADCDSAVEAFIRRIKGQATLESGAEWVRLNHPRAAEAHGLQKAPDQ